MVLCVCVLYLINLPQSSKKDEKRNGDIIPPLPFYMRPTGLTLYMRQKLGSAIIQKSARCSLSLINVKDIPKPTGVCVCVCVCVCMCVCVCVSGWLSMFISLPLFTLFDTTLTLLFRVCKDEPVTLA